MDQTDTSGTISEIRDTKIWWLILEVNVNEMATGSKSTCLHYAARNGQWNVYQELVSNPSMTSYNVQLEDEQNKDDHNEGNTPLLMAIVYRQVKQMQINGLKVTHWMTNLQPE